MNFAYPDPPYYWSYGPDFGWKREPPPDFTEAREKRLACRVGWQRKPTCRIARAGRPSRAKRQARPRERNRR